MCGGGCRKFLVIRAMEGEREDKACAKPMEVKEL
jgi:hypothetical protein